MAPGLVDAGDVLEYDLDGEPVDARGRASYQDRFIHSEIYRARPEVNAVVHCHTTSLIPFADSEVPLRAMYQQSAFIAEGVPVFDIRSVAGMTDLLGNINARAQVQAIALGGRITYIDPEEANQRSSPRIYDRAWELWKRSVMK